MKKQILFLLCTLLLVSSCSSFQASRVDGETGDKKALQITDKWVLKDTEDAISEIMNQIKNHKRLNEFTSKLKRAPRVFIMEVQNETSEPYFPIGDLNDELLNELSASGDYTIIDNQGRDSILKEIKYQAEGMVNPKDMIMIGKQTGADLIILGSVRMNPETRDGKTIKQYTVNMRMTDLKTAEEVLRVRHRTQKFSETSKFGW